MIPVGSNFIIATAITVTPFTGLFYIVIMVKISPAIARK
jgi:hypothetical protein